MFREGVATPPPPPLKLSAPVIGFRGWHLTVTGLNSMNGALWTPGVQTAKCLQFASPLLPSQGGHAAPAPNCSCGLYALYELPTAQTMLLRDPAMWSHHPLFIIGAVLAWGERFFAHGEGFRAEYAKPIALTAAPDAPQRVRRVLAQIAEEDYGARVVPREHLELVARDHGDPVPMAARFEPRCTLPCCNPEP